MSLTITDATSPTPANRTYVGVSFFSDLATWKDFATNGNTGVGAGVATLSVKENGSTTRVSGKLVVPTMETISGDTDLGFDPVPTKAFECIGSFDLVLPVRASLQNRKDLLAMLKDYLADAVVTAATENFVRPSA